MNIWDILKIDETKDKEILKSAYRKQLTKVNPEDDPEGFMQLRQAYEEAVKLADSKEDTTSADNSYSPLDELLEDIKDIYYDFNKRIDVEVWKKLFNSDIFISLESSEDAFNTLMKFLMDNFYLPQKIWRLIRDTFDIEQRKKEYAERFPEDFIDYIINNSTFDDILNYYLFDGDLKCADEYIAKYYRLDYEIRKHDVKKQDAIIEELEQLDVYHPYLDICKIRNQIQKFDDEDLDSAKDEVSDRLARIADNHANELMAFQNELELLCEDIKDDLYALISCGDVAMTRLDYKKAREFYEKASSKSLDNYIVKGKLANVSYFDGDYEKSRDLYLDLLKINHYDNNVRAGMIRANSALIEGHKKKLEVNPKDDNARMEMAWCYYQCYNFQEVINTLNEFEPEEEKKCEYYNVKGRSYLCLRDYENAKSCFFTWVEEILKIPEDDLSEDAVKKKKRYEYANFLIADCYLKTKQFDEARKYLDIALANEHEEIVLSYEALCELEYETDNYEACIDACEKLQQKDKRNYIASNYLAKACLKLDYVKESLNACEKAISIYPYISEPYINEIKIYLKYNKTEPARHTISRYRELGINSDYIDYFDAVICSIEEKYEEAIRKLEKLKQRINPDDTDMEDVCSLYIELGFCYEKTGDNASAISCYDEAISLNPKHESAHGYIALIYKNNRQYKIALDEFTKQIEIAPKAYYFINRGLINEFFSNSEDALSDYCKALETEPSNCFCLNKAGMLYEKADDLEKALQCYNQVLSYARENDKETNKANYKAKARVLQCMNRFDDSKEIYEKLIDEFGLCADEAYDFAELLLRMNNMDEAVAVLIRCINELEYSSDVQMCIRQLCRIYGQEGYVDKAYESFELAISKNKEDYKAYATMGEVFINAGLYEDAAKMYEKAVETDRDNNEKYYSKLVEVTVLKRGFFKPELKNYIKKSHMCNQKLRYPLNCVKMAGLNLFTKKYQKALEFVDKALREKRCPGCFYGRCHEALYEKGLIYEAMKDYERARVCYREALEICGHNLVYEEKLKRIEGK